MEPTPTSARRHDLDALRGFAMLLGIALHAGLAYSGGPWMVQDSQSSSEKLTMGSLTTFGAAVFFLRRFWL